MKGPNTYTVLLGIFFVCLFFACKRFSLSLLFIKVYPRNIKNAEFTCDHLVLFLKYSNNNLIVGAIFIHTFGAYFGIAMAFVIRKKDFR